ncbi:MAG: hypothetical protein ACRD2W_23700 [Acidimicrobiales bacterium]
MSRRGIQRWALCATGAVALAMAAAANGWACASVAALDFSPAVAAQSQEVAVKITFVNKDRPVELRWDALNGPLLATIDPATFTEGLHGNWRFADTKITIPANATAGNHLVIATQEAVRGTATWGMPARGLIQVSGAGTPAVGQPVGPAPVVRPGDLVAEEGLATSSLLIAALGAAGLTMLVGGVGILLVSIRRGRAGVAAPVRTGTGR